MMTAKNIRFVCRIHGACMEHAWSMYGVCHKTFYSWLKKFRACAYELDALANRPRSCKISPKRIDKETVKQLCA